MFRFPGRWRTDPPGSAAATVSRSARPGRTSDAGSGTIRGLAFAVASAASFGLSGSLAKGLLGTGWSSGAAVLARVLVAAVVLAVPAALSLRGRWVLLRRNAGLIGLFGLMAVVGTQFFYFQAIASMQVGVALLIEYTAPVAVVAWLWLRFGHRPGRLTLVGAAIAAVGLVLVLDLFGGVSASVTGILWASGAMFGAAAYFILAAQEAQGLPPLALAGSGMVLGAGGLALVGGIGLIPLSFATAPVAYGEVVVPWWVSVLALGVVTSAVAYTTGIAAGRLLGSRLASFVALLEVIAALGFAWLLLGELPRPVQVAGGSLILVGVVVVKLGEASASGE